MARRLLSLAATAMSVLLLAHEADAFHDIRSTKMKVKSLRAVSTINEFLYEEAIVDHNATLSQQKLWKQRYFINHQFWGGKGFPVFFANGSESAFRASRIDADFNIHQLAQKHKALIVGLEHRYYGQSYPTSDLSLENLRFLTSEQQLADVARFHGFLTKKMGLETSKWIAFGGSYAGSLAAWLKLKYPTLFVGAIASSAPLEAKSDFSEFNEIVGRSLRYFGGDECYNRIEQGVVAFRQLVDGGNATQSQLQNLFPMCNPIKDDLDLSVYESAISFAIQGVVQENDYTDFTIPDLCAFSSNQTQTPLQLLSAVTMKDRGGACLDSTFAGNADGQIEFLENTAIDSQRMSRQWFYQTCNEFGWFQTTTSPNQPFFALKSQTEQAVGLEVCKRLFNMDAAIGVAKTNARYGGINITAENVTFVSGSIDPWSAASVIDTTPLQTNSSSVVYIVGTSHATDTLAPAENNIPAFTAAYVKIAANVAKYLGAQQ